jgi:protocatechuate 3,4-dioxygenase beta subunit
MAMQQDWTRYVLLGAALLAAAWALVSLRQRRMEARPVYLAPTPACGEDEPATPRQTAGPFFKSNTPARTSLIEPGIGGERVMLEGYVVSTQCQPIAGVRVELWHADRRGLYDLFGFRLRGHQYTDAAGRYRFETIVPGSYGVRTRHYHVKVQAPGRC